MANAKRCDRCGRFYDFYEGVEFIDGGHRYINIILEGINGCDGRRFDLCPDCMRQVIHFLHNESNTYSFTCKDCKHFNSAGMLSPCVGCKRMNSKCDHDHFEYNEKKEGE